MIEVLKVPQAKQFDSSGEDTRKFHKDFKDMSSNPTNVREAEEEDRPSYGNRIEIGLFLAVGLLTLSDLIEDHSEGAEWSHVFVESIIMFVCLFGGLYLWRKSQRTFTKTNQILTSEVLNARADAAHWRAEAATYLDGLGIAIDEQFNKWSLTAAEKEVGLLLLKGLSHKEVADIRSSSERTVRQQAAAIYRKGNLEGRAQLSAFFLEDLLLPITQKK